MLPVVTFDVVAFCAIYISVVPFATVGVVACKDVGIWESFL